jgi:hypothetical protein
MIQPPLLDRRAATNRARCRALLSARRAVLAGLLVASVLAAGVGPGGTPAQAAAPVGWAYLWANQPRPIAGSYTPIRSKQFNSTGALNTVTWTGVGAYTARLPNLGAFAGTVHVTAVGSLFAGDDASGPGSCKAVNWRPDGNSQQVNVRCFDLAGRPVDGSFALTYTNLAASPRPMAYLRANSPASASYTPTLAYQFNSSGATNTITRSGIGAYTARLPNLGANAGHVQVTAYGWGSGRCQVANWGPSGTTQQVRVRCFNSAGTPRDTHFTLTFVSGISLVGSACCSNGSGTASAYAWANSPASASYTPTLAYQFNSSGATNTIARSGVGAYRVNVPQQDLERGTVQVTAYGTGEARCKVASWTPSAGVQVRCFDRAGDPKDTTFDATFLASTGLPQRLAVPSYFYPGPRWTKLEGGAPTVELAIINPDSGPAAAANPDYVAQTAQSQAAGLTVLGYVYTDYGARPAADVKAEVDAYYGWYGVDGIFFDEAFNSDCTKRTYYREIYNHVKAKTGKRVVVINPGARTQECYALIADDLIIVNFESEYAAYPAWQLPDTAWERHYPPTRFWHLVHTTAEADMPNAIRLSKQRNAGYVYVTPDVMDNPWNELPPDPYWSALLARAGAL